MKYVVVVGDGMADYPLEELKGRTPLEEASTPNMDYIAEKGCGGRLLTIPQGLPTGSDVANLSLLGYNPEKYYTGRGALEAAAMGVELKSGEVAFRCNLITVEDGRIADFTAGHISSEEAAELISLLNSKFSDLGRFYPGVSYRNLFVTKLGAEVTAKPPHDIVGEEVNGNLLRGKDAEPLNRMMLASREILSRAEVNLERLKKGKKPANMIWLWGQGKKPELPDFHKLHSLRAGVIAGVDLIRGIGKLAGMQAPKIPGATGYYDTDYSAKAEHAIKMLQEIDFCYIHVEAPDEASHEGNVEMKIKCIEEIDTKIVGRILDELPEVGIAVTTDHATPIDVRTHVRDEVPFAFYCDGIEKDEMKHLTERESKKGKYQLKGWEFLRVFLRP